MCRKKGGQRIVQHFGGGGRNQKRKDILDGMRRSIQKVFQGSAKQKCGGESSNYEGKKSERQCAIFHKRIKVQGEWSKKAKTWRRTIYWLDPHVGEQTIA